MRCTKCGCTLMSCQCKVGPVTQAVTGELPHRALHEVQAAVHQLCRRIESAAEACEWTSVHNLAEWLRELAERGMFHASKAKAKEISQFALGNHNERESR